MNLMSIFKGGRADQPRWPKGSAQSRGGQFRSKEGSTNVVRYSKVGRAAITRGLNAAGVKAKDKVHAALKKIQAIEDEYVEKIDKEQTATKHQLPSGAYTPERLDEHRRIINDFFKDAEKYRPPEGQPPKVLLLAGLPGAGKSGFGENLKIYDPSKYLVLDSDAFKKELPEYDPERPGYVHREASDLMDRAGMIARIMGLNVVYDTTMKKPQDDLIKQFRKYGYEIEAHHMKVSMETSMERAAYRWAKGEKNGDPGRLVPPSVITEMTRVEQVFSETTQKVDHWTEYDHEELGRPRRVNSGGKYRRIMKALTRRRYVWL